MLEIIDPVNAVKNKLDTQALIDRPLSEWRNILIEECQVYVYRQNYLAKRFDSIHYQFCDRDEAKEILIDNLYSLLRFKYFPSPSEETDIRIKEIVNNFTDNLKTTLKRITFDIFDKQYTSIKMLPNYCLAFRNGVYDFKHNKWLFKYQVIHIEKLSNTIYLYDSQYVILWYFDYNFEPLDFKITDVSLKEFIKVMKSLCKTSNNYCFELMYNMAHSAVDTFNYDRFVHLCQVMGYLCLQSMSEHFCMLIGRGGNGKNSLIDGCFTCRIIPSPASNDLKAIETDKFITGALENIYQNIYLESSTKDEVYEECKSIKNLTGTTFHTIEKKGINKYSGYINCKQVFAANDQDKLKFNDTTPGFIRRINVFEIYYQWDAQKRYMMHGDRDYYDTTFSEDLHEIKNDALNTTTFIYFAMYGILLGTDNFTHQFKFLSNDWKKTYSNVDLNMKEQIEALTIDKIYKYMTATPTHKERCKVLFYDEHKQRLYSSQTLAELGYGGYTDLLRVLKSPEMSSAYFNDHDVYINLRILQNICNNYDPPLIFTQRFKKLYDLDNLPSLYNNQPYVKISLANERIKVIPFKK